MNTLVTPAIGEPNSFLRHVQVDPTIAMDFARMVKELIDAKNDVPGSKDFWPLMNEVERKYRVLAKLHNLEPRE